MSPSYKVDRFSDLYFITTTITNHLPIFSTDKYRRILAESLSYCVQAKGLLVHAYAIMPTHLHVISSHVDGRLSETVRDMKKFTSKTIAANLEADGHGDWLSVMRDASKFPGGVQVWTRTFHAEYIITEGFFRQKFDYIHDNPVRAGLVEDMCAWEYSSAGFYYLGRESMVPVSAVEW